MKKKNGIEVNHGASVAYTFHKCRCRICKDVQNTRMRAWRKASPIKHKRGMADNINKQRNLVKTGKDKPCTDCGKKYPYYTMQYDHARGVKKYEMSTIFRRSTKIILEEIAKCDVVCANCHTERTYQRAQAKKNALILTV